MNNNNYLLIALLLVGCGRAEPKDPPCKTFGEFQVKSASESFETLSYSLNSCLNIHDIAGPGKLIVSLVGAPDGLYTLENTLPEQKTPVFTLPLPRDENHYLLQIRRPSSTSPAPLRLDATFELVP